MTARWQRLLRNALPALVSALGIAAVAALAGEWLWTFLLPTRYVASIPEPPTPDRLANQLQSRHLFGTGLALGTGAAEGTQVGNLRLIGVAAGADIALISVSGRPARSFRVGHELATGVRLLAVSTRKAEIEQFGKREVLLLPAARSQVQR
jgi:hypothetical protein